MEAAQKENSDERSSASEATQKALQSAIRDRKEAEEKQAIEKKGAKSRSK
jgi:hypothetical protein